MSDGDYEYDSDADGDDFVYDSDEGEYGIMGDANSIVHSKKESQWMNLDDLNQSMSSIIAEVQECVGLPAASVAALLRFFFWNKEKLFDEFFKDPAKVQEKAGILEWGEDVSSPIEPIDCRICYAECSGSGCMAAPCGHFFCTDCYTDYLSSKVNDGPGVIFTKCPEHKCPCLVPPELFLKRLEGVSLAKFKKYTAFSYVDLNKSIRWCPGPACLKAVRALPGTMNVKCKGTTECVKSLTFFYVPYLGMTISLNVK